MGKNKIYVGGWSANNNSTYSFGYKSTNKKTLASDMRKIAKGNTFHGNCGYWEVFEIIYGEQSQEPILSGKVSNKSLI